MNLENTSLSPHILEEVDALQRGGYYRPLHDGNARKHPNDWIDLDIDALRAFRELNRREKLAVAEMTRRTSEGERFDDWILDAEVRFPMTTGAVIDTMYGRSVGQGSRGHLYRGERKQYESSRSSLGRELTRIESPIEAERYRLVAYLRIAAFMHLTIEFETMKKWLSMYDVDLLGIPLAQHYGFQTEMIDFTDDFDTALFFATCWWDETKREWRPLTREMIRLGEASEFGVIFHAPRWQAEFDTFRARYASCGDDAYELGPIGFQPFQRCHNQHGYGLELRGNCDLQGVASFEKLRFRQSVELSEAVFELMDGGKKVYPDEGLLRIEGLLAEMRGAWQFSKEEFDWGYALAGGDARYGSAEVARSMLVAGQCLSNQVSLDGKGWWHELREKDRAAIDSAYAELSLEAVSGSSDFWYKARSL